MNDNFYDFDKDDTFDESFSGTTPPPAFRQKEFEISIPAPKSALKSTVSSVNSDTRAKTNREKAKKLSPTAMTFSIMGIVISFIIIFTVSCIATMIYLPRLTADKPAEMETETTPVDTDSHTIKIEDDGSAVVDDVPKYNGAASEAPSKSETDDSNDKKESDDDKSDSKDSSDKDSKNDDESDTDNENETTDEESTDNEDSSSSDEIITV